MNFESSLGLVGFISTWIPTLKWLTARLSVTSRGRTIEATLREHLGWLKNPEAEKAFHEAFKNGIECYQAERGSYDVAQTVIRVLAHVAEHDTSGFQKTALLQPIFDTAPNVAGLSETVKRHAFALHGADITPEEAAGELEILVIEYLRPAFITHPFFSEQVGFAEVVRLLTLILETRLEVEQPDWQTLQDEYLTKMIEKYEIITMQGISPKVHNRTIGIRMSDVFIPLRARRDLEDYGIARTFFESLAKAAPFPDDVFQISTIEAKQASLSIDKRDLEAAYVNIAQALQTLGEHSLTSRAGSKLEMEKVRLFMSRSGPWSEKIATVAIEDLLQHAKFVVQGDPGSGKSTLTQYIVWAIASDQSAILPESMLSQIPIRVRAIEFGEALDQGHVNCFDQYLIDASGRFSDLVKVALLSGNAFILLDGLDEVGTPALRMRVKERVDDFVADPVFADNRLTITTRIVGYERSGIIGRFPHFTLAELNDEQIVGFVDRWYNAIHSEMPEAINVDLDCQLKALMPRSVKWKFLHHHLPRERHERHLHCNELCGH